MAQNSVQEKLATYFTARPEVQMAFLFGSRVKGVARPASDWDVGVYLTHEDRTLEHELWANVEHIVGGEADLVILNRAPATLVAEVVGRGVPLVIRDRLLYLHTLLSSTEEADAFHRTAEEYYRTFERSASLNALDREELLRIMTFLESEIADYVSFREVTWADYADERDKNKRRAVERWVEQVINAYIDVAKIIVASEKKPMPHTYREIVELLGTVPPFDAGTLTNDLARWTRVRNVLAHEYLDLRWKEVHAFVMESEQTLQDFLVRTKTFLDQGASR